MPCFLVPGPADELAGQGQATEDDLQVLREASAFHLKLSESVLRRTPGHLALAESVAAGFTQYAYAFVALEADRFVFLLALNVFLFAAGALMEIYAALVVLVPLLLPVAQSYGIDPVHFGIIFLPGMEMGFLYPPAGMNIYFASALFAAGAR